MTIDPDVQSTAKTPAEDEGSEETDPDRVITNARRATPSDGLLTNAELVHLYASPVRSVYDEGLLKHRETSSDVVTYGDRVTIPPFRQGANEPEWTAYTHFWKTVLGTIRYSYYLPDSRANLALKITYLFWILSVIVQSSLDFLTLIGLKILILGFLAKESVVVITYH